MKTAISDTTQAQLRSYRIFKGLAKFELIHLANEMGLSPFYYNTHAKRAAAMTYVVYHTRYSTHKELTKGADKTLLAVLNRGK